MHGSTKLKCRMEVPYRRFGTTYRSHLTSKIGPIGCPGTSEINYHSTLQNSEDVVYNVAEARNNAQTFTVWNLIVGHPFYKFPTFYANPHSLPSSHSTQFGFTSDDSSFGTLWIGGWLEPRAGHYALEERQCLACRRSRATISWFPALNLTSHPDRNIEHYFVMYI
jgi:hypothetical protein